MIKSDMDILSEYYQYELAYLRSAGDDFASKFPKIARRLDLSNNESSDPHVERLIESFAFLTGKLQRQIDDQFPAIATCLLETIFPPLVLPAPSCAMINFDVDQSRAAKMPGFTIPKDTLLHAYSTSGDICSLRTSHDLQLWPIEIVAASLIEKEQIQSYYARSVYYLKITLKYNGAAGSQLPQKLRFYMHANALLRGKIFSAIFSTEEKVIVQNGEHLDFLPTISPIGLEEEESLFPYPTTVHSGFRLLQEYFAFAEKFYGFDVCFPDSYEINDEISLFIPMSYDISMPISIKNFSISSVPSINLFSKVTEPLRLDNKQMEYCLVADYRRYDSNEIYSIEKMVAVDAYNNDEIAIPEFFSCGHSSMFLKDKLYWKSRRKKSYMKGSTGEDVYVSFVDMDFSPEFPSDKIFYAYTLCTNRGRAEQIPANGELQIELSAPTKSIRCIDRPTTQKPSINSGEILWKLISALSLNSISFKSEGIAKLKSVINVFADISRSNLSGEIDAIASLESALKTKRIDHQTWCGFIRGTDVEITFDETIPNLGLPLSLVISKFLSSYTTINTFTEVVVKSTSRHGVLKKWNHCYGIKNYL
jgi:type VI secretion system protein ImpG